MTDRQILEEVYHMAVQEKRMLAPDRFCNKIASFIEQEWQREDERVQLAMYNRNRPVEEHALDVQEIEIQTGLEIGPDGTVKESK